MDQWNSGMVYVALYDYKARTKEDLSFHKGDQFEVLDKTNQYWWKALALTGDSALLSGYIPANYVAPLESLHAEPWYFPDMKRAEAERLLLAGGNQHGAFLIRDSESQPGELSMSVLNNDTVNHYLIMRLEKGQYGFNKKVTFSTLTELVEHYSQPNNEPCTQLSQPCKKVIVPQTNGLCYNMVDQWEIPRDSITLLNEIGSGNFGKVYKGLWNNTTLVAVKTAEQGSMNCDDFLREAQIMKKLLHPKLIQLFGVCTIGEPIYIITELMHSSLLDYLRKDRGQTLGLADEVAMATQVASGMEYLEKQNYIHRDLAARNVLVGENKTCKVADFGLSRVFMTLYEDDENKDECVYQVRRGTPIPTKWMAPEVLIESIFTIKSDVWSFGVLLNEIMTYGQHPYSDLTNNQVIDRISNGYRMPCPDNCPMWMYDLMKECWRDKPSDRPTFKAVRCRFDETHETY